MRLKTPIPHRLLTLAALAVVFTGASPPPLRIASTAPGFTEILFAIGAEDQLVADSDYCAYPEAARAKPKIGGPFNLNYERLVALRADLVVVPKSLTGIAERCQSLGLRVEALPNETISDLLSAIRRLGVVTGNEAAALSLAADIERELAVAPATDVLPVRALIVVFRAADSLQDLTVATRDTFLSELLTRAGGRNVMGSAISRYPRVSKEEVVAFDPDVILDLTFTAEGEDVLGVWSQLPTLKAVRTKRVVSISDPSATIPGPRMLETLRRFRTILSAPAALPP